MEAYETDDIVCFSSNTTLLSKIVIKANFEKAIDYPKGFLGLISQLFGEDKAKNLNDRILKKVNWLTAKLKNEDYKDPAKIVRIYKVMILEIEWLEDGIILFLANTVQNHEHFEVEVIKILLDELSYPWSLYVFLFLPYAAYCGVLTYYYGFCLT